MDATMKNDTITDGNIETVTTSFVRSSVFPASDRDDAHQLGWQYLCNRRTKWTDDDKLRSQARNAIADATRTLARQHSRDRFVTLSALVAAREDLEPMHDLIDAYDWLQFRTVAPMKLRPMVRARMLRAKMQTEADRTLSILLQLGAL
jgi:hypothetical protein